MKELVLRDAKVMAHHTFSWYCACLAAFCMAEEHWQVGAWSRLLLERGWIRLFNAAMTMWRTLENFALSTIIKADRHHVHIQSQAANAAAFCLSATTTM